MTPKLLVERKKWSGKLAHIPPLEGDNPDRRIVWSGRRPASKKKPDTKPGSHRGHDGGRNPTAKGGLFLGHPDINGHGVHEGIIPEHGLAFDRFQVVVAVFITSDQTGIVFVAGQVTGDIQSNGAAGHRAVDRHIGVHPVIIE